MPASLPLPRVVAGRAVSCRCILSLLLKPTTASAPNLIVRAAVLCGAVTGALCFAWILFLYFSDNNPYGPKRLLSAFFTPIGAIAAQALLRYYYKPENLGLWKSIAAGALTVLIASAIAATTFYLFSQLTGPGLIEQHLVEARQLLESTKAMYLKETNGLQQYNTILHNLDTKPIQFAEDEFSKKLLFGVLMSIPGGVFLRK